MRVIAQSTIARTSYWRRRILRHGWMAGLAALMFVLAYVLIPSPDTRHRVSMASAYTALAFLVASLSLGPWNVLRSRPNPVSFDLRRDPGICARLIAIFHTREGL